MKRTSVKRGKFDQRNRATQRRRQRQALVCRKEPDAEFVLWLKESGIAESAIHRINITDFLRCTQHFDLVPEERLRQLAIHIENKACSLPGESGWYSLKRIYDHALKLNKNDERIWFSMGIAACETAECQKKPESRKNIYKAGEHAVLNAIDICPDRANAHYILGYLYYFLDRKQAALYEFEKALSCENRDKIHSWSQLYKAHCLHDMHKWDDALKAYNQVDLSEFSGFNAWRIDVLHEQKAYCSYMTGRKEDARQMLINILDRYEAEPALAVDAMSSSLWELVELVSDKFLHRLKKIQEVAFKIT